MKKILIIGEEYWFESIEETNNFQIAIKKASVLLDILEKNTEYNFEILEGPKDLIKKIKKDGPENIKAMFFFHDPLSDSILNNMTIKQVYDYLIKIEKEHNIFIYPGLDKTNLFASKKYYKILIEEMPYMALPHSSVLEFNNYKGFKSEKFLTHLLLKKMKEMLNKFDKVILKKGYSYGSVQVKKFTKKDIESKKIFSEKVKKLNFKNFWGVGSNAVKMDEGIDRYYIFQGFNNIIKSRQNEFRIFFFNGKASYITWTDNWDNVCTDDIASEKVKDIESAYGVNSDISYNYYNPPKYDKRGQIEKYNKNLLIEILRFAKKAYTDFLPHLNKLTDSSVTKELQPRHPIMLRLDISYAMDKQFQDEYSIKIKGLDTPIRIYINEIEIDPTNFFYNNMVCKSNKNVDTSHIQKILGNGILDLVKKMK
tara:strand:+ start:96 stop:1367 length:1272 start_codon:yes stop_codon:yes gene_type:complete